MAQVGVDGGDGGLSGGEGGPVVGEGCLEGQIVEALRVDPGVMFHGPVGAVTPDAAVAEQELA